MAALAGELNRQIKGHSEGEKGFRPWWDTVEDNLMYAFVLLGKNANSLTMWRKLMCPILKGLVTLPMTFFSKTPIECTPHPDKWDTVTEVCYIKLQIPKTRVKKGDHFLDTRLITLLPKSLVHGKQD